MGKLRSRELQKLAQGHMANKWQRADMNFCSPAADPRLLRSHHSACHCPPPASFLHSHEVLADWNALSPLPMRVRLAQTWEALANPVKEFGLCPEGNREPLVDLGRCVAGLALCC